MEQLQQNLVQLERDFLTSVEAVIAISAPREMKISKIEAELAKYKFDRLEIFSAVEVAILDVLPF